MLLRFQVNDKATFEQPYGGMLLMRQAETRIKYVSYEHYPSASRRFLWYL